MGLLGFEGWDGVKNEGRRHGDRRPSLLELPFVRAVAVRAVAVRASGETVSGAELLDDDRQYRSEKTTGQPRLDDPPQERPHGFFLPPYRRRQSCKVQMLSGREAVDRGLQ